MKRAIELDKERQVKWRKLEDESKRVKWQKVELEHNAKLLEDTVQDHNVDVWNYLSSALQAKSNKDMVKWFQRLNKFKHFETLGATCTRTTLDQMTCEWEKTTWALPSDEPAKVFKPDGMMAKMWKRSIAKRWATHDEWILLGHDEDDFIHENVSESKVEAACSDDDDFSDTGGSATGSEEEGSDDDDDDDGRNVGGDSDDGNSETTTVATQRRDDDETLYREILPPQLTGLARLCFIVEWERLSYDRTRFIRKSPWPISTISQLTETEYAQNPLAIFCSSRRQLDASLQTAQSRFVRGLWTPVPNHLRLFRHVIDTWRKTSNRYVTLEGAGFTDTTIKGGMVFNSKLVMSRMVSGPLGIIGDFVGGPERFIDWTGHGLLTMYHFSAFHKQQLQLEKLEEKRLEIASSSKHKKFESKLVTVLFGAQDGSQSATSCCNALFQSDTRYIVSQVNAFASMTFGPSSRTHPFINYSRCLACAYRDCPWHNMLHYNFGSTEVCPSCSVHTVEEIDEKRKLNNLASSSLSSSSHASSNTATTSSRKTVKSPTVVKKTKQA